MDALLALSAMAFALLDLMAGGIWPMDLSSFFRPWLNGILLCLGVVMWARSRGWPFLTMGCAAALYSVGTLAMLLGALVPVSADADLSSGGKITLLTFNVWEANPDLDGVVAYLNDVDPDVIVLQEVEKNMHSILAALPSHPHTRFSADVLIASRYPFVPGHELSEDMLLSVRIVRVVIQVPDGRGGTFDVSIYGLHPQNARSFADWSGRNEAFDELVSAIAAEKPQRPVIVAGDLNLSSWSHRFSSLLADTGMDGGQAGNLFAATRFFPRMGLPVWLGAPIDHILVGRNLRIEGRIIGPAIGSDHLPLVATISRGPPEP